MEHKKQQKHRKKESLSDWIKKENKLKEIQKVAENVNVKIIYSKYQFQTESFCFIIRL